MRDSPRIQRRPSRPLAQCGSRGAGCARRHAALIPGTMHRNWQAPCSAHAMRHAALVPSAIFHSHAVTSVTPFTSRPSEHVTCSSYNTHHVVTSCTACHVTSHHIRSLPRTSRHGTSRHVMFRHIKSQRALTPEQECIRLRQSIPGKLAIKTAHAHK